MKLTIPIVVLAFTAPALADAPPPPVTVSPVRVALSIKSRADSRIHELVISDHGCGVVKEKSTSYEDDIRVCSRPATNGLLIETEWFTRDGSSEYRTRSEVVLARKGGRAEIGRPTGMRLVVKIDPA